jgi:hypothetical protein
MHYKRDKHPLKLDEDVLRYTTRRIRELRGKPQDDEGMHPYIRRRLDELKRESEKKAF